FPRHSSKSGNRPARNVANSRRCISRVPRNRHPVAALAWRNPSSSVERKGSRMTVIKAERPAEADQAAAAATAAVEQVEGEIRAFVRRDLSAFRRQQAESGGDTA